jgi:hypothetical protein
VLGGGWNICWARKHPLTPQPEGLQESATEAFMDAVQFKKD